MRCAVACDRAYPAIVIEVQSAASRDPDAMARVLGKDVPGVAGGAADADGDGAAGIAAVDAVAADPKGSGGVSEEAHEAGPEVRDVMELPVLETVEVLIVGADPGGVSGGGREGADPLAFNRCRAGQRRKPDAVKAGESFAGADEQVAAWRVLDGVDVVVRQAVLNLPDLLVVLGEAQAGVESQAGQGTQEQEGASHEERSAPGRVTRKRAPPAEFAGLSTRTSPWR
ncbi:MAG: hypothetical protein QM757_03420 [Paludibaculum sp.]